MLPRMASFKCSVKVDQSNVDVIRANDGKALAPQETCLRQASDPVIG
jgi:hypothetical protein